MSEAKYVLITAARNEAACIGQTLASVAAQSLAPLRWVIVSDGSTDDTDRIVQEYAAAHPFITLVRRAPKQTRDFSSKVAALNEGFQQVAGLDYEFLGIADADVTFLPEHFERILALFAENPKLGIAGGGIHEMQNGAFAPRSVNRERVVPGAAMMFRRACFEAVGGFLPLRYGGEDLIASFSARMRGWDVKCFADLPVRHLRPTGGAVKSVLANRFREGRMDHAMGYHPLYALAKGVRRLPQTPFVMGSMARLAGYGWAAWTREDVGVPRDIVQYMRDDQMQRLRSMPGKMLRRGKA